MKINKRLWHIFIATSIPLTVVGNPPALDLELHEGDVQPDITIQTHENRTMNEYRVNGNLYMVKVEPTIGPSYYIVDPDGDGDFERRRDSGGFDVQVPQWVLFSW